MPESPDHYCRIQPIFPRGHSGQDLATDISSISGRLRPRKEARDRDHHHLAGAVR
jgi:hypothetical protein